MFSRAQIATLAFGLDDFETNSVGSFIELVMAVNSFIWVLDRLLFSGERCAAHMWRNRAVVELEPTRVTAAIWRVGLYPLHDSTKRANLVKVLSFNFMLGED